MLRIHNVYISGQIYEPGQDTGAISSGAGDANKGRFPALLIDRIPRAAIFQSGISDCEVVMQQYVQIHSGRRKILLWNPRMGS